MKTFSAVAEGLEMQRERKKKRQANWAHMALFTACSWDAHMALNAHITEESPSVSVQKFCSQ